MLRKLFFGLVTLVVIVPSTLATAAGPQEQEQVITPQPALQAVRTLVLPLNKSEVFRVNRPLSKVAIGNPAIIDAVAVSTQSFYVFGKKSGSTNLLIFGPKAELLAVIDVIVGTDVEGVKRALYEAFPNDKIDVRAVNDTISLSGSVNSALKVGQAAEIARQFVDKDKTVINNIRVTSTQQVMLQVKVAEVERSLMKALDFHPFLNPGKSTIQSGFTTSTLDPITSTSFLEATGTGDVLGVKISDLIDALEQKQSIKILAEPNLVAMSGDTASFLAGGEFPIPVVQSTSGTTTAFPTITIQFQQFGVSLAFTPTVVDTDLINLVVAPEVSQLNPAEGVTIEGFVIPGIDTRRAKTTVELRDGQSFAIAGLISSDFNDTIRGIPALMDVPIIGALFRGASFTHDETELVIIVTPRLVKPAPPNKLAAPTDTFVRPSDAQLFLFAHPENPDSGVPAATDGGGLTGSYGHIIR